MSGNLFILNGDTCHAKVSIILNCGIIKKPKVVGPSMVHLLFSPSVFFAVNRKKESENHNKLGNIKNNIVCMCNCLIRLYLHNRIWNMITSVTFGVVHNSFP